MFLSTPLSRRAFVTSAALAGGATMLAAAPSAHAAQAQTSSIADASTSSSSHGTVNSSGIVVDPASVTEEIRTDILVVGGGFSGLACAVQAAENGDGVILLEAQSLTGGNGQGVEGTLAVDSVYQKEQGITVDKSIIMQEELSKTQWCVNGLYYKDLIDNSADNIKWAVDEGCVLSGLIDNYPFGAVAGKVDTFHWWEDGAANVGYVQPLTKRLYELGVDVRLNTRGLEFSYASDGSVDGVYALDAFGDLVNFKATAVVLATGGFANDDARLVRNGFVLENLERIGTPGHFGDGINMAIAGGCAEFTGVCYLKYNRISSNYDIAMFGPFWSAFCFGGPFLWLNADAERFVDESCTLRTGNTITQSTPVHNQGCQAFVVFDDAIKQEQVKAYKDDADEWGVDIDSQMETLIADGDDVWRADTLEEVAEAAGLDPEAVKAAVEEYNASCEAGKDEWYGKDAEYLKAIKTAPFYVARMHEAMEGPLGGVKTDRTFRPLLAAGGRLENVFVIGLDGIMLYRDVYPIDVPGSASAECLNGGRVSANEAHKLAQAAGPNKDEGAATSSDPRTNAKQVIMAASNLLASMDLGLTDEDSPVTLTMGDATYDAFFTAVKGYKKVAGLELTECSITADVTALKAATARADSQQTNYLFTITAADMVVNGKHVTYSEKDGLQAAE